MVSGKPLFAGGSEEEQLKKIFKIRGTPSDDLYPEITKLPDWDVYILLNF